MTEPNDVTSDRLLANAAAVLRLVESLWVRRPAPPLRGAARKLPGCFTELSTLDISTWRTMGRVASSWCIARLVTFGRHLHQRPTGGCPHHSLDESADAAWRILASEDGTYLYTRGIAHRYERDRPHDPEFVDAITSYARQQLAGADVVEVGAGTGAVTRIIAGHTRTLLALEPAVAMRRQLEQSTQNVAQLTVRPDDAMSLRIIDNSVDVAVEHAALCFVDEPLIAVCELMRVLRPEGRFVRIISSRDRPAHFITFADAFHAELRRRGYGRFRITGKGNDQRITAWLAAAGIHTSFDTIAAWTATVSLRQFAAPLVHGGYPYLAQVSAEDRHAALESAIHATGMHWDDTAVCQSRIITATAASNLR